MLMCKDCNLNPFVIREKPFKDFCILADKLFERANRENKKYFNGMRRVKAGNNWF